MSGIVRRIGWETDEETGEKVFRAIVEYPDGPPDPDLPLAVVWQEIPVKIVVAAGGVGAPTA